MDLLPSGEPHRILDLGTGPGTILLALLAERPAATGLGVDLSGAAIAAAEANASALGLGPRARFRIGSWAEGITEIFDLVVSNPPYIPPPLARPWSRRWRFTIRAGRWMAAPTGSTPIAPSSPLRRAC